MSYYAGGNVIWHLGEVMYAIIMKSRVLSHKLSSDTATWYNDTISASDKHALVYNWKAVTHSIQSSG